jgi:membrane-bound lytic murein transglycosylase D
MHGGSPNAAPSRVKQLRPLLEPILREEGVPADLMAVVLVESGGRPAVLSPKGALGIWQLMPQTARRYGLTVTPEKDERLDVLKATRAAARYLHDLYGQFSDWKLALTAYDAGEQKIERAVDRAGSKDFEEISWLLPAETRNYVPAVLAAFRLLGDAEPVRVSGPTRDAVPRVVYAQRALEAGCMLPCLR